MGTHIPPVINRDCSNGSTVSLMLGNYVSWACLLWHTDCVGALVGRLHFKLHIL